MKARRWAYFLLCAVALLSATACERTALNSGAYGQDNAISLALSLKNAGNVPANQTKMSSAITQNGSGFRGIEQLYIVPFQTQNAEPVSSGSARLGSRNVGIPNPEIGQTGLIANNNSHLYDFVQVPQNTNRVLAYGKAFDSGSVSTKEGKHKNGVLTAPGLDNPETPGDISFSLESILETSEENYISQQADKMIAALNGIVETLQEIEDADIQSFLSAFTFDNQIIACSDQTFTRLEQSLYGAISEYQGTNAEAFIALNPKISALQVARKEAGTDFPAYLGIPEGSIGMWWNGHRYVKIIEGVNISLVPAGLYCYPPSLWYYVNSPVKTTEDENVDLEYKKSQNDSWDKILSKYPGSSVEPSTRSVAIVGQMEYGVGLVEFFLSLSNTPTAITGCPMTGIIIGDQKDADYSFAPKSNSASRFIYDNNIGGVTLSTTPQSFQTLVLPTASGQSLHFALELKNNKSFAIPCQQGAIQPGCKFYIAGELKPELGTKPALDYAGGVFESDHKTCVTIRGISLNNIYNTVPDLSDPQLELGVVAEIDWVQLEPGGVKLPF